MSLNDAIAKTTLPVEDLARAKAFYAEKLGLRPTREFAGALFYKDIVASVPTLKSRGIHLQEYDLPRRNTQQGTADLGDDKTASLRDRAARPPAPGHAAW